MTAESTPAARRRALLGDDVIAHIEACVDAAPEPEPGEWIDALRRILSGSATRELPASNADAA